MVNEKYNLKHLRQILDPSVTLRALDLEISKEKRKRKNHRILKRIGGGEKYHRVKCIRCARFTGARRNAATANILYYY